MSSWRACWEDMYTPVASTITPTSAQQGSATVPLLFHRFVEKVIDHIPTAFSVRSAELTLPFVLDVLLLSGGQVPGEGRVGFVELEGCRLDVHPAFVCAPPVRQESYFNLAVHELP